MSLQLVQGLPLPSCSDIPCVRHQRCSHGAPRSPRRQPSQQHSDSGKGSEQVKARPHHLRLRSQRVAGPRPSVVCLVHAFPILGAAAVANTIPVQHAREPARCFSTDARPCAAAKPSARLAGVSWALTAGDACTVDGTGVGRVADTWLPRNICVTSRIAVGIAFHESAVAITGLPLAIRLRCGERRGRSKGNQQAHNHR